MQYAVELFIVIHSYHVTFIIKLSKKQIALIYIMYTVSIVHAIARYFDNPYYLCPDLFSELT